MDFLFPLREYVDRYIYNGAYCRSLLTRRKLHGRPDSEIERSVFWWFEARHFRERSWLPSHDSTAQHDSGSNLGGTDNNGKMSGADLFSGRPDIDDLYVYMWFHMYENKRLATTKKVSYPIRRCDSVRLFPFI
jgi:hypothetical protein